MRKNILSAIIVLFVSVPLWAQSTKGASNNATQNPTTQIKKELTLDEELSLEPPVVNTKTNKSTSGNQTRTNENISSKTEFYGRDDDHALKGFSVGAVAFNQNFNAMMAVTVDGADKTFGAKSKDFQFVGGLARYTIFPYSRIGTDVALSVATSVNHAAHNFSALTSVKAELNFGYAWKTLSKSSLYALGGIGYENVKGKDIEKFISPSGAIFNAGLGINFTKTILLEGLFTFSRHKVSSVYIDQLKTVIISEGATSVEVNEERSVINSYALQGRLVYAF